MLAWFMSHCQKQSIDQSTNRAALKKLTSYDVKVTMSKNDGDDNDAVYNDMYKRLHTPCDAKQYERCSY